MAKLLHELWKEVGGQGSTFCLAGPMGEGARKLLGASAKLIWSVEANSHFEAMTKYYEFMGWGKYTTEHQWDLQPYPEEWLQSQQSRSMRTDDNIHSEDKTK
jgi:hypothetical protein